MKYRDFSVKVVLNGFVITIGCQQVVASTPEQLIELVKKYMKAPQATESLMLKNDFKYCGDTVADGGSVTTVPRNGFSYHLTSS